MPDNRYRTSKGWTLVLGLLSLLGTASAVSAQVAERDLSNFSSHSQPFTVTITVTPPVGTIAYGIEDAPPSGWTDVSNIDNSGIWDSVNKKVKWGPYFTDEPITLHYDLAPPVPLPGGTPCFRGVVSVDGDNQSTGGTRCLPAPIPTLSEWGLASVAMSLLIAGTLLLRQRTSAVAVRY